MPVEDVHAVARMPVPFGLFPELVDAPAQAALGRLVTIEILPRAQKSDEQISGLHEVAAVVLAREMEGPAGRCRSACAAAPRESCAAESKKLVILRRRSTASCRVIHLRAAATMIAIDAESGSARHDRVEPLDAFGVASVARKAAMRVSEIPEISEGLPLHELEELIVGLAGPRKPGRLGPTGRCFSLRALQGLAPPSPRGAAAAHWVLRSVLRR